MLLLYLYMAFILIVFSGMLLLDVSGYLRRNVRKFKPWYPKALVIIPVKGLDIEMRKNLEAVKRQDYKGVFDIIAVADSKNDPAMKELASAGIRHIISDVKSKKGSGKVRAIATALQRCRDYEVYAILDSDVRVGSRWLAGLAAPLKERGIGLSTTFPLFEPRRNNLWSYMKMVWGLVGIGLMESKTSRFGWGGSMAFRRDLVDKKFMRFFTDSEYSVSDDICVTKTVKSRGLGIEYVGGAMPRVPCDESRATFFEWADRQTALTLLGYKANLYFGTAFYSAEILLLLSAVPLAIAVSPLFVLLWTHQANSIFKAYTRTRSKSGMVVPLTVLLPFIYLRNLLHARNMDSITWRGNLYALEKV